MFAQADRCSAGCDPAATDDAIYFGDPPNEALVQLDRRLYERYKDGAVRCRPTALAAQWPSLQRLPVPNRALWMLFAACPFLAPCDTHADSASQSLQFDAASGIGSNNLLVIIC